jgi:hypothetical protein
MRDVKVHLFSYHNSLVLMIENAEVCVILADSASVREAVNDTKRVISKTNEHVWMKLKSCRIHIEN